MPAFTVIKRAERAAMGRADEPLTGALFEVEAGVRGLTPDQFGGLRS